MSNTRRKITHCDFYTPRKVAYATENDAYSARENQRAINGAVLRVYRCPRANHYHLTHHVS